MKIHIGITTGIFLAVIGTTFAQEGTYGADVLQVLAPTQFITEHRGRFKGQLIEYTYYDGGHMMSVNEFSRLELLDVMRAFSFSQAPD